jgi:hypothetical protein
VIIEVDYAAQFFAAFTGIVLSEEKTWKQGKNVLRW